MSEQHRKSVEGEFIEIGSGIKAELKGQPVGQKPSVTRNVHYHSLDRLSDEPQAAIIVRVDNQEKETVSLVIFSSKFGVFFKEDVSRGDEPGQWNWPPRV